MKLAGSVLASGFSRRFGFDKTEAVIGGKSLLLWAVDALQFFMYKAVVLRRQQVSRHRLPPNVSVLVNRKADEGMSAALKLAVSWVPHDAEGLAVILGDMPFAKMVIPRLIEVFFAEKCEAVATGMKKSPVNPAIFSRRVFHRLLTLSGDVGAKAVLTEVDAVVVDVDEWMLVDVDTEKNLHEAEKILALRGGF